MYAFVYFMYAKRQKSLEKFSYLGVDENELNKVDKNEGNEGELF